MKAISVEEFGEPEVLELREVEDPPVGPGQVLVEVRAAGVNPVDTYIRTGTYSVVPQRPYVPGLDAAGVVAAVGDTVEGISVGDRVYASHPETGTYAEKSVFVGENVHPLPDNVSFPKGAALGVPYVTAYRALYGRAEARPGDTVLVHGATGGVGTAAVQWARAGGMRVLGTGGSPGGREMLHDQGVDGVFDHHDDSYMDRIAGAAGDSGVDVILEMLANRNLGGDLELLGDNGRVMVIGCRGEVERTPRDLMDRDADIRGVLIFNTPDPALERIHRALRRNLRRGRLDPVIARTFPLGEAAEAHRAVAAGGARGKIVLLP